MHVTIPVRPPPWHRCHMLECLPGRAQESCQLFFLSGKTLGNNYERYNPAGCDEFLLWRALSSRVSLGCSPLFSVYEHLLDIVEVTQLWNINFFSFTFFLQSWGEQPNGRIAKIHIAVFIPQIYLYYESRVSQCDCLQPGLPTDQVMNAAFT